MDLGIQHDSVVVMGGAGAIGQSVASSFAEASCRVAILDSQPSTVSIAERIQADGLGIRMDVTDFHQVKQALQDCIDRMGHIDHLVFAVGAGSGKFGFPFWNLEPSDWHRVMQINLLGAVHAAHAFAPHAIRRQKGSITFFTSVAGQMGSQTDPPYSAAKAGLINFMQCVAKDLAPYKVRANAIAPGMVQSDLNRSVWQAGQELIPEEDRQSYEDWAEEKIRQVSPLGEWQTVDEYGAMAVYLASSHARHMTGQVINIDGGQIMRG